MRDRRLRVAGQRHDAHGDGDLHLPAREGIRVEAQPGAVG